MEMAPQAINHSDQGKPPILSSSSALSPKLAVSFDRYSLLINGRREFIRSGAMHYFRLPSQDLWRDRLYKLKSAGYNTVDLYFCWAYHSPAPGVYNFSGIRDVRRLLEIVQEMGLYLIARPGPYINAEYTAGGLPGWLLAEPGVVLRNRLPSGSFVWSEPYMEAVREWWGQIVPLIRDFPNMILFQIENEYATVETEPDYMQALYRMSRDLGITAPIFHNDFFCAGLYEDIVDIYAFDNYSVTQFDADWREVEGVFDILDHTEENFRPFSQNRPLMVAELQAGWFGKWKGFKYEEIISSLGREHISISTRSLLGQGLTIFNHYKAVGGTNWNTIGSTDTYTSYDFGAPISEAGLATERLYAAKTLNYLLMSFDLTATDRVPIETATPVQPQTLFYAERALANDPSHDSSQRWLFLRNLQSQPVTATIEGHAPFTVQPHEALILPRNIRLLSGGILKFSSLEPLYQTDNMLIFKADRDFEIQLAGFAFPPDPIYPEGIQVTSNNQDITIQGQGLAPAEIKAVDPAGLRIIFLGSQRADTLWVETLPDSSDTGRLITGPEALLSGGYYAVASDLPLIPLTPDKPLEALPPVAVASPPTLPPLTDWQVYPLSDGLFSNPGFQPVNPAGADFDHNHYYEGCGWYRYILPPGRQATRLTLDARHFWAVFMNGQLIRQGQHILLMSGEEPPPPQTIDLSTDLLNADRPNEIVIFVDGLGHPKGFNDDAHESQGLLHFEVNGKDQSQQVLFLPGLQNISGGELSSNSSSQPVAGLRASFTMPDLSDFEMPLGLHLHGFDTFRINIYLNDVLIGRYWRDCQCQMTYYLPPGILNTQPGTENTITLVLINFDPLIDPKAYQLPPDAVKLTSYGEFTKIKP